MKFFIAGILTGGAFSAIIFIPLLISEQHNKFQFGIKNGIIAGKLEAVDALGNEFGFYDRHSDYKVLFSVKAASVISIETNGVKTVRIIP
jgi:hypothetical protein